MWWLVRDAVGLTPRESARLRGWGKRGATIFNPDDRRVQNELAPTDPVLRRIEDTLRSRGFLYGRAIGKAVVLHSFAGCRAQPLHCDYDPDAQRALRKKPLGVLVAIEEGTALQLGERLVSLHSGDMLVFEGDQLHAGAAYDVDNTRIHVYVDSPVCPGAEGMTWLAADHDSLSESVSLASSTPS